MEKMHAFGVGLTSFSAALTIWSYLILSNIPLTALGIGLTILGISIFITPPYPIPSQTIRTLLEGSVLSLEALLEELNISAKGYYVQRQDGRVYLYIPMQKDAEPPTGKTDVTGLIAQEGGKGYLVLLPPASELIKSQEISDMGLDTALNHVLVDITELTDSVDVSISELVTVRMKAPKANIGAGRFKNTFGSLEASIAACITASLIGPTKIVDEIDGEDTRIVLLEVKEL